LLGLVTTFVDGIDVDAVMCPLTDYVGNERQVLATSGINSMIGRVPYRVNKRFECGFYPDERECAGRTIKPWCQVGRSTSVLRIAA